MSDLQCEARVFVAAPSARADDLVARLAGEHIAAVYSPQSPDAAELSRRLGGVLLPMTEPVTLGAVLNRRPVALSVLRDLTDLHRGETVLVLSSADEREDQGVVSVDMARVLVDADGIVVGPG